MTKLTFDRAGFAIQLTAFRSAAVAADGKGDKLGSSSMAALILEELTPLALAISFYDTFAPKNAKGKLCEPKEADDGTIRVRSLEQANCRGSGGARKLLESLLYSFAHRATSPATVAAVEAFAMGEGFKGVGERTVKGAANLAAFIRSERSRIAREQAGTEAADNDDTADDAAVEEAMTDAERLAAALGYLKGVTNAPSDASERMVLAAIAAEIDRIGAIEAPAEPVADAA